MAVGLSTYAFFWRISDKVSHPLGIEAMLEQTAELGGNVFQICDYPKIETLTDNQLENIRKLAESFKVTLELGTKGIEPQCLDKYLHIAKALDSRIFRTMFNSPSFKPNSNEIKSIFAEYLPKFEQVDTRVCIETYEQIKTKEMVAIVKEINHPFLGICLDPANCIASLEYPSDVIDMTADLVINLHIKDFAFTRRDGWVGFSLSGANFGEGLLDYDYMMRKVKPNVRGINQVIEHWIPWQESEQKTCKIEQEWTEQSLKRLIKE